MAFTYDLTTDVGKVRLLIPDNVEADAELQDDELEYFLDQTGDHVKGAAVLACKTLARKYARQFSFRADGLQIDRSKRAEVFAKRAEELEAELSGSMSTVELNRTDGYEDESTDTDYESRTIYIKV